MYFKLGIPWMIISLTVFVGCKKQGEYQQFDKAEVIEQVREQVSAFYVADTSRNAEKMVSLLWPEFTLLVDGNRVGYEDVQEGSKSFMASLETFHTKWEDLKILPLSGTHAISSFIFTDSLVAMDGTITQATGPNTFVWEKREGEWKVLYGDADHYPIESKEESLAADLDE